jgi:6-phosphogluconolactonase
MSIRAEPEVRIHADLESLSRAVAESLAEIAAASVTSRGWFSLALSGGETPRALFRMLRAEYEKRVPWVRGEVFWVDERYAPHQDPRSNYGMARREWIADSSIPREHVHPMETDLSTPAEAAWQYERVLRAYFPHEWPRVDLMLLGLGVDCHTASLFPESPALSESARWVTWADAPSEPSQRLTLALPVINHSFNVHFLVSGEAKAEALRRVLEDNPDVVSCPASGVDPPDGRVIWWVDEAAASRLSHP